MRGIGKTFPGVRALSDVSLTLYSGEVLALVGENGAGKSTLMKILAGAERADTGAIVISGKEVTIDSPHAAEALGIGMIYQEFNLVPQLTAVENIVLGAEPRRGILLDARSARARAKAIVDELGMQLALDTPAARLSVGQQQMIEIAKALSKQARIIVMDEPTAALSGPEIERLFALIGKLRNAGASVIYISHRMEELPVISDRITVLRDGSAVESRPTPQFPQGEIIRAMVGRSLDAQFPKLPAVPQSAPVVLDVRNLNLRHKLHDVAFNVRAGEIVGLAGLVGAGRTETLRSIAGADVPDSATITIDGKVRRMLAPSDAIAAGVAFITEDRKAQGLVLGMTVRENITLAHLAQFINRERLIDQKSEEQAATRMIAELHVRTPSAEQIVRNLSGGNQQKVVLAKWLLGKARVFLFDEPTRGIDVGAKTEIYHLMLDLVKNGAAIVMVSSELPEVLGMSHRVLAMREGRVVREFTGADATPEAVIAAATGAAA
ncbi:MAG: sugar ABC transporter ATP-binding protein [Candidatus Eremiobacteraeota bacterium]|nr:sugar ABC transporter ATP-binding protein [Candidatus Eremiobacteraeota bacterium]